MRLLKCLMVLLLLAGCGKKEQPQPQPPPVDPILAKPVLIAPAANESCYTGTIISSTQSEVTFAWAKVEGAKSYVLQYTDLVSGQQNLKNAVDITTTATLKRFTPYQWMVKAIFDNSKTTESDASKFYNAGPTQTYYAPYPAYLMAPELGKIFNPSQTVSLQWKGSSVQNNITGFDVYYGATVNPPLILSNTSQLSLNVTIQSGKTYYWKIVTRDASGNTSESLIYQFSVR